MKLATCLLAVLLSVAVRADDASKGAAGGSDPDFGVFAEFEDRTGFFFDARVGLNLASFAATAGSNNRVNGLVGVGTSYFFSSPFGAFLEIQYTNRALTGTGGTAGSNFVDVAAGIAWNRGAGWLKTVARETYRLGVLYGQPLNTFRGSLPLTFSGESQGAVGVYVEHQATFPIADHIGFGYTVWVKGLFTSAVKATPVKFVDVGIGLLATFF